MNLSPVEQWPMGVKMFMDLVPMRSRNVGGAVVGVPAGIQDSGMGLGLAMSRDG